MSTTSLMPEKQRARMQKSFAPLMEPGETVVCGLPNQTVPFAVLAGFMMLAIVGARCCSSRS